AVREHGRVQHPHKTWLRTRVLFGAPQPKLIVSGRAPRLASLPLRGRVKARKLDGVCRAPHLFGSGDTGVALADNEGGHYSHRGFQWTKKIISVPPNSRKSSTSPYARWNA